MPVCLLLPNVMPHPSPATPFALHTLCAQELVEGPWRHSNLDAGASMLIPVPATGGAVVVGESVLTFVSAGCVRSTAIKPTLVKVHW